MAPEGSNGELIGARRPAQSPADPAGEEGRGGVFAGSAPGARASPSSIRPGKSDARVPNCSAMTNGEWLGSMIPPEPTRMLEAPPAIWAITPAVAAPAMPGQPRAPA